MRQEEGNFLHLEAENFRLFCGKGDATIATELQPRRTRFLVALQEDMQECHTDRKKEQRNKISLLS